MYDTNMAHACLRVWKWTRNKLRARIGRPKAFSAQNAFLLTRNNDTENISFQYFHSRFVCLLRDGTFSLLEFESVTQTYYFYSHIRPGVCGWKTATLCWHCGLTVFWIHAVSSLQFSHFTCVQSQKTSKLDSENADEPTEHLLNFEPIKQMSWYLVIVAIRSAEIRAHTHMQRKPVGTIAWVSV